MSAPIQASASVHVVPASNCVRSSTRIPARQPGDTGVTSICRLLIGEGSCHPCEDGVRGKAVELPCPLLRMTIYGGRTITLFGRCRDLYAAERRHYLLREPVQLFQRLAEPGAQR